MTADFPAIAEKVFSGQRISSEDALALFHHPNPLELAALADARRQAKVPGRKVTYIVGRITLHDNSVRVFRGVPSRPGESLQRSQLATGQFQIAAKGVALKGQA